MSLRTHLLLWFLLFALFSTVVGVFFTRLYVKKKNDTFTRIEEINQYSLQLSRLKNYQHQFFTYDIKTPAFYVVNGSENLSAYHEESKKLSQKIRVASLNDQIIAWDSLVHEFALFDSLFNTAVKLSYARGYKDFGLIGEMRQNIHILENFPQIDQTKVLSLRRHEKDYIIRNEEIYIDNFHRLYNRFLPEIIQNQKLTTQQKSIVIPALKKYHDRFNDFTLLNSQIGDENSGHLKALANSYERVEFYIQQIKTKAATIQSRKERQLAFTYGTILLLLIVFAGLAGWYVSGKLTKPFYRLVRRIKGIQTSDQYENKLPPFYSNQKEINQLYASFNNLLDKLSEQAMRRNNISIKMMNRLNLHKDILNSIGIIVFTCDENGKISYANHHFYIFTGYSEEDIEEGLFVDEILLDVPSKKEKNASNALIFFLLCKDNSQKQVRIEITNNSALKYKTIILFEHKHAEQLPEKDKTYVSPLPLLQERN